MNIYHFKKIIIIIIKKYNRTIFVKNVKVQTHGNKRKPISQKYISVHIQINSPTIETGSKNPNPDLAFRDIKTQSWNRFTHYYADPFIISPKKKKIHKMIHIKPKAVPIYLSMQVHKTYIHTYIKHKTERLREREREYMVEAEKTIMEENLKTGQIWEAAQERNETTKWIEFHS